MTKVGEPVENSSVYGRNMKWSFRWKQRTLPGTPPDSTQVSGLGLGSEEVLPPWVAYPGIPSWDFFWREAGQNWRTLVWEPYYNGLSELEQSEYLRRWNVPDDWKFHLDKAKLDFWNHVDDPE